MNRLSILLLSLGVFVAVSSVGCSGNYKDPLTGKTTPWAAKDNPTVAESKDYFRRLEEEKAKNEAAVNIGKRFGNKSLVDLGNKNLENICKAKKDICDYLEKRKKIHMPKKAAVAPTQVHLK